VSASWTTIISADQQASETVLTGRLRPDGKVVRHFDSYFTPESPALRQAIEQMLR
jgi:hypothetical protein